MVKKRRLNESNLPAKKRALISRRDSDDFGSTNDDDNNNNDNNSNNNSNSDSPPNGRALISQRVSVLWDDDGKWYSGIITDFRNAHGKREHQIVYDVDNGAVMRSVPQAQGLLANGTTTHEWLVFEPEANSKEPKITWRLIQDESVPDNDNKDNASSRGGRKGPGPNAKGSSEPPPNSSDGTNANSRLGNMNNNMDNNMDNNNNNKDNNNNSNNSGSMNRSDIDESSISISRSIRLVRAKNRKLL